MEEFGIAVVTPLSFEQAVMRTRLVLRSRGFGILSEMPAPVELGQGTGRSHVFMSVWQRILSSKNLGGPGLDVGDHLSCNFVVYEDAGETVVACLDPTEGLSGWDDAGDAAGDVREILELVLNDLANPS